MFHRESGVFKTTYSADMALYQAKHGGRNQVVTFGELLDAQRAAHAESAADRIEALAALGGSVGEAPVRSGDLVDSVFVAGLTRWFAPLFWFVVFGPAGAAGWGHPGPPGPR